MAVVLVKCPNYGDAIEMTINGLGIRDTARVLKISTDTVINVLKKDRTGIC